MHAYVQSFLHTLCKLQQPKPTAACSIQQQNHCAHTAISSWDLLSIAKDVQFAW